MTQCDMQVKVNARTWRSCKRKGIYILTDKWGETWLFCKQHFDAYHAAMG